MPKDVFLANLAAKIVKNFQKTALFARKKLKIVTFNISPDEMTASSLRQRIIATFFLNALSTIRYPRKRYSPSFNQLFVNIDLYQAVVLPIPAYGTVSTTLWYRQYHCLVLIVPSFGSESVLGGRTFSLITNKKRNP